MDALTDSNPNTKPLKTDFAHHVSMLCEVNNNNNFVGAASPLSCQKINFAAVPTCLHACQRRKEQPNDWHTPHLTMTVSQQPSSCTSSKIVYKPAAIYPLIHLNHLPELQLACNRMAGNCCPLRNLLAPRSSGVSSADGNTQQAAPMIAQYAAACVMLPKLSSPSDRPTATYADGGASLAKRTPLYLNTRQATEPPPASPPKPLQINARQCLLTAQNT